MEHINNKNCLVGGKFAAGKLNCLKLMIMFLDRNLDMYALMIVFSVT